MSSCTESPRTRPQEDTKSGLLLINLGSPTRPDAVEIRSFLRTFLSDRRVVNLHPWLWQPILRCCVLPTRPRKIMPLYRSIWFPEGSPLTVYSRRQEKLIQAAFGPDVMVRVAMTYTQPSVNEALEQMQAAGVNDLTVINMYPQYAASTVAAGCDAIFNYYLEQAEIPTMRMISSWETESNYIEYWAQACAKKLRSGNCDALVFSYHSVPDKPEQAPERYREHCNNTTRAICQRVRELLADTHTKEDLPQVVETFQSKFGPGEWIGPATIETLPRLARAGMRDVVIATPGFITDCLETIDEIGVLNRDVFLAAGGSTYRVVPPPNDDPIIKRIAMSLFERMHWDCPS